MADDDFGSWLKSESQRLGLPRLAPEPDLPQNFLEMVATNPRGYGYLRPSNQSNITFDEFGRPYDEQGNRIEARAEEPSLGQSLLNIAESPARLLVGAITEPINAIRRLAANSVDENGRIAIPNPENPQNRQDVLTGLLSLYGGNAMNPAAALPKNAVGMFAGRMAKTADHAALARAEELAGQGVPRDQIWNETGWFQGPDKKWRFEIDDSKSSMVDPWGPSANSDRIDAAHVPQVQNTTRIPQALGLDDYLSHPELARAYWPVREDAPGVIFDNLKGNLRGSYSPSADIVTMDSGSFLAPDLGHSTALHELQHAIQNREGFARGDMIPSGSLRDGGVRQLREVSDAQSIQDAMTAKGLSKDGAIAWLQLMQGRMLEPGAERWIGKSPESLEKTKQQLNGILSGDTYRRSAGEVEARNVQKRINMTPEERRATPPWETQDVPDSNQIVRLLSDTGKPSLLGSAIAGTEANTPIRGFRAGLQREYDVIPDSTRDAFWASSSPEVANTYAGLTPQGDIAPLATSGREGGQAMVPANFTFANPLVVDAGRNSWNRIPFEGNARSTADEIAEIARERGHDGLVLRNVYDSGYPGSKAPIATTYAALKRGTVTSPLTGELLFSDVGHPSIAGAATAGQSSFNDDLKHLADKYGIPVQGPREPINYLATH